jgi:hypothetical protein
MAMAAMVAVAVSAACTDGGSRVGPVAAVAKVTMTGLPNDAVLLVGGSLTLAATVTDASGKTLYDRPIEWSSSNTAVATITVSGVVTGTSAGSATITATSGRYGVAERPRSLRSAGALRDGSDRTDGARRARHALHSTRGGAGKRHAAHGWTDGDPASER